MPALTPGTGELDLRTLLTRGLGVPLGILARTRVGQSGTSAGLQIAGGWLAVGPAGLLAGPLWNTGVACAALCRPAWRALGNVRWSRLTRLALDYRRFPLYSTAEAVANSAALYLPVIVIAAHASSASGCRLVAAPSSRREYRSMTVARYRFPAAVGISVA